MKITKRQLRRIIKESIDWTPEEKASYDEGFEQGNHDAIEQMGQGEVMRHMFDSQEEYEAFVRGYDDGYQGTMDVLPSRYHENRIKKEPLGGWAGNALHNDPHYKHHTDTDHFKIGDLVRSVDYEGDGWGGDYERSVGDQVGTVVEIDEDPDGTQYVVLFADGSTIMDTADSFEAAK